MSKSAPIDAPMLTEPVMTEYVHKEIDSEWLYGFMGKVASKEPIFWRWIEDIAEGMVLKMASKLPATFAHPLLGVYIKHELVMASLRGYFMGMRKYESSWESMFQATVLGPGERPKPKKPRKPKKSSDDGSGESEIEDGDIAP